MFIGPIKTKSGEVINGVWQRPYIRPNQKFRGQSRLGGGHNTTGHLKLLVRFNDPQPVKQQLHYRERAKRIVAGRFDAEFRAAMAKALASARL